MSLATPPVRAVAVFCGSRLGRDPGHREACAALGRRIAECGLTLVYGGGCIGLMGVVADAVIAGGGRVVGVIPRFLTEREVAHAGLAELRVPETMHERKTIMFGMADLFIVMPGGLGTLDETVEILTWKQLGLHDKPIWICNEGGWASSLLACLRRAGEDGFADPPEGTLYSVIEDVATLLARLGSCREGVPGL